MGAGVASDAIGRPLSAIAGGTRCKHVRGEVILCFLGGPASSGYDLRRLGLWDVGDRFCGFATTPSMSVLGKVLPLLVSWLSVFIIALVTVVLG